MTQTDVAASAPPTAFQELLKIDATPYQFGSYRGVLTALFLDAPQAEIEVSAAGAAVHDLGWLKRVAVRGEDRFRWLSGMVTNTVNELGGNHGAWNLVLNAQGRIQGDLTVWREGDELELEIATDQLERLIAHFERFIIMDDVELVPLSGDAAIGLTGPAADQVLARVGLPVLSEVMTSTRVEWNGLDVRLAREFGAAAPHYALRVPEAQLAKLWKFLRTGGAIAVGSNAVETLRIAEGIPLYGIDMLERDLPQETSQMRALHFSKGCYLGQEIVERIRSRGNVHRHLRQLELLGPLPNAGTELTLSSESKAGTSEAKAKGSESPAGSGVAAGHMTSVAELTIGPLTRTFALGMIRSEAEVRNEPLTYSVGGSAGTARILAAAPKLG